MHPLAHRQRPLGQLVQHAADGAVGLCGGICAAHLTKHLLLADDREGTADSVERLMGTKAEARFAFISDKAEFASDDLLDV